LIYPLSGSFFLCLIKLAKLAKTVPVRHTVHRLDHIAVNEDVLACDMADVPLEDEVLDAAIFSLSLMGANFVDCLKEEHRILKLDEHLHIIEATSRFIDRDRLAGDLKGLVYSTVSVEDRWKFTHIRAFKTELQPREYVDL